MPTFAAWTSFFLDYYLVSGPVMKTGLADSLTEKKYYNSLIRNGPFFGGAVLKKPCNVLK